jgi:hypothetical protein
METKEDRGWNPYLAGALAGVLIVLSVLIAGKYFGVSTSYVRTAGFIENALAPERTAQMSYFLKYLPKVDWQWMFVVGIVLGAFVSAITSGSFRKQAVPDMWRERFGSGVGKRAAVAFSGGVLILFGARLAGG